MLSNQIPMTALRQSPARTTFPSGIAMPTSGCMSATAYVATRDRDAAGAGTVAVAQGTIPGSTAWSPPTC